MRVSMFIRMFFIFIIFFIFGTTGFISANTKFFLDLKYESTLFIDLPAQCKFLAHTKNEKGLIACVDKNSLHLFELSHDDLKKVVETSLPQYQQQKHGQFLPWTVANLNNIGFHEIVLCLNKQIYVYQFKDGNLTPEEFTFPYYMYGCVAGDVTNNGSHEIVVSALPFEPEQGEQYSKLFRIILLRFESNNLYISYDRVNEVGLSFTTVVPSGKLIGVMDIFNSNKNELIISEPQSDVSPTVFGSFIWTDSKKSFKPTKVFFIVNNKLHTQYIDATEIDTQITGPITPVVLNGKTYFVGHRLAWNHNAPENALVLMKIENNTLQTTPLYFDERYDIYDIQSITATKIKQKNGFFMLIKDNGINPSIVYNYFHLTTYNATYLDSNNYKNLDDKSTHILKLLKGEILARHGHDFNDDKLLREHFDKKNWYKKITKNTVTREELSAKEKQVMDKITDLINFRNILKINLLENPIFIPFGKNNTPSMSFDEKSIIFLDSNWVFAFFDNGHYGGEMILTYNVSDNNNVSWQVLKTDDDSYSMDDEVSKSVLIDSLRNSPSLIPFSGKSARWLDDIKVLSTRWVYARFQVGSSTGAALLEYKKLDDSNEDSNSPEIISFNVLTAKIAGGKTLDKSNDETIELFKIMIEKGANINDKDNDGKTPLMLAAFSGNTHIVSYLIKKGANVNAKDMVGNSALMYAVMARQSHIVELLIKSGARVNVKNAVNKTPLDYAKSKEECCNYPYITELLERAHKK